MLNLQIIMVKGMIRNERLHISFYLHCLIVDFNFKWLIADSAI